MARKAWYLLAYDVSDNRRLQRLHYRLTRTGIAAQKSVFFIKRSEAGLKALLDELEEYLHAREDDLRVYPIRHPGDVWFRGKRPFSGSLTAPAERVTEAESAEQRGWLARLFGQSGGRD